MSLCVFRLVSCGSWGERKTPFNRSIDVLFLFYMNLFIQKKDDSIISFHLKIDFIFFSPLHSQRQYNLLCGVVWCCCCPLLYTSQVSIVISYTNMNTMAESECWNEFSQWHKPKSDCCWKLLFKRVHKGYYCGIEIGGVYVVHYC